MVRGKGRHYFIYSIILFTVMQLSCFAMLGFWIYWYVTNDSIYTVIANLINPELLLRNNGGDLFVFGLALLSLIITGSILLFVRLIKQILSTRIYDSFIGNVTHELKSPLASIQLGIETMQKRTVSGHEADKFLQRMAWDTMRLDKLISSILEISSLDSRRNFFYPETVPAAATVKRIIRNLSDQFRMSENEISLEGDAECSIFIDYSGLTTVLGNLVDNSIKYSTGPVRIKIGMGCSRNKFVLFFSDNGTGISGKEKKVIFDKFTRLNRPDSDEVRGTGLGLYWSREILKLHKGRISLVDKRDAPGSCFRIELPAVRKKRKNQKNRSRHFG